MGFTVWCPIATFIVGAVIPDDDRQPTAEAPTPITEKKERLNMDRRII